MMRNSKNTTGSKWKTRYMKDTDVSVHEKNFENSKGDWALFISRNNKGE